MAVNRDPDFLARGWVYEEPMCALASSFLDETGRLQPANHFFPAHSTQDNRTLGYSTISNSARRDRSAAHDDEPQEMHMPHVNP